MDLWANETPGVSELDVHNRQSQTASIDFTAFYVQSESGVHIRAPLAAAVDVDLSCLVLCIRVVVPHGRTGAGQVRGAADDSHDAAVNYTPMTIVHR